MIEKFPIKGVAWVSLEKYLGQILGLLFSFSLMFFTSSDVFGEFALIAVSFALANMISEGGLTIGMIKATEDEFNSTKILTICTQLVLSFFCVLWFTYFTEINVSDFVLITINTSIMCSCIISVLVANLSRKEKWNHIGKSGLISQILAITLAVFFVFSDFFLEALIIRLSSKNIFYSILLVINTQKENFKIKKQSRKDYYSILRFSMPIFFSGFINNFYDLILVNYIGLRSISVLGFFNRSRQLGDFVVKTPSVIFERVLFLKTKNVYNFNSFIKIWKLPLTVICVIWICFFLFNEFITRDIISHILPKWLGIQLIIRVILIAYLFNSFSLVLTSYYYSIGSSFMVLVINIVKLILLLLLTTLEVKWDNIIIIISIFEFILYTVKIKK